MVVVLIVVEVRTVVVGIVEVVTITSSNSE